MNIDAEQQTVVITLNISDRKSLRLDRITGGMHFLLQYPLNKRLQHNNRFQAFEKKMKPIFRCNEILRNFE